jgi:structural maintenance of chromosome 1
LTKLIEQVSGSDAFIQEYEKLREEKEKASEIVITNVNKKKGVTIEKKNVKNQKKDAERFQSMKEEHEKLQIEYVLWRLYYIEKGVKDNQFDHDAADEEIKKLKKSLKTAETELTSKKKELSGIKRENLEIAKKMKTQNKKLQDEIGLESESNVSIQHVKKIIDQQKKELNSKEETLKDHETQIKELEKQLKQVEKDSEDYEKQLNASKKKEIKLLDDQVDEYNRLKAQAGTETITMSQELETLNEEIESSSSNQKILLQKIDQLENRRNQLQAAVKGQNSRLEKLNDVVLTNETELNTKRQQKRTIDREAEERTKRKEKIENELFSIKEKLQDAKFEKKETERQMKFNESIESMKRLFSGVKGKMVDLCKVSRDKYNLAVSVALGKNFNAIVVDSEKTAIECIQYLKEQRIGNSTFIPLDTIQTKKINDKYRALGENIKLAIDVISFETEYTSAFTYALGNTVVCETIDDATELCYERQSNDKIKAVTIDGTVISKAGLITGGRSEAEKTLSSLKQRDLTSLKQKRDDFVIELQEITRDDALFSSSISKFENEITQLENRIKYTNVDVGFTKKKLEQSEQEIETIEKELKEIKPNLEKFQKRIEELSVKASKYHASIKEIEERIFAKFSKKVGVDNIREYEENQLKLQREAIQKKADFKILMSRIQNKLEYERERDLKTPFEDLNKLLQNNEKEFKRLEKDNKSIVSSIKVIEDEIKKLKQDTKDAKTKLKDQESAISVVTTTIDEINKNIQKETRTMTTKDNQIEQLRNRRQDIYRKCQVEEIELPLGEKRKKTKKQKVDAMEEDEESYIQLSEPFSVSTQEESQGGKRTREEFEEITLDFSDLDKQKLNKDGKEYDQLENDFKKQLSDLSNEISKLAPSLASIQKMKTVESKLNELEETCKEVKDSSREANRKFEEIKKKRYDAFMTAFDPISSSIDSIYKDLTKTSSSMGGTAYLALEDIDEPYNFGIKFNAMPPSKRYRDMEELSGGEKTIAALALLFAINSFKPSPFFILDEVDAALDNVNVNKVANYILSRNKDMQFLVISLKDSFFTKAETLVGIHRKNKCSNTLTMDLRKFDNDDIEE